MVSSSQNSSLNDGPVKRGGLRVQGTLTLVTIDAGPEGRVGDWWKHERGQEVALVPSCPRLLGKWDCVFVSCPRLLGQYDCVFPPTYTVKLVSVSLG